MSRTFVRHSLVACFLLAAAVCGQIEAAPTQVDVDTIWDDNDAKDKCQRACTDKGLYWTGSRGTKGWVTQHYCVCDSQRPPASTPPAVVIVPGQAGGAPAVIVGAPVIRYDNTDFVFNDIRQGGADSFEACAAQCQAENRCVAFTYSRAGTCYLKSGVSTVQKTSFGTSGYIASRGTPPPHPGGASPANPPSGMPAAGVGGMPPPNAIPAAGALRWVPSGTGQPTPANAVAGGVEDGAPLLVCRAAYYAGVYPGKLVKGNCNIAYAGREIYMHEFEVLTGSGARWGPPRPGFADAMVAGGEGGVPFYACQAEYRGGQHPGKVVNGLCNISYAGAELPQRDYLVLYSGP